MFASSAVNLVTGGRERRLQQHRHAGRFDQQRANVRHDALCADRNEDAEFAQQATEGIEPRGSRREPGGSQAMQRGNGLMLDRLDGHGVNLLVSIRFEEPFRIGAVGFIASDVRPHVVRGQQPHGMPEWLQLARPVMSRTAGLEHDGRRRLLGEEREESIAREPPFFIDLAGRCDTAT